MYDAIVYHMPRMSDKPQSKLNITKCRAVLSAAKLAAERYDQEKYFNTFRFSKVPVSQLQEGSCGTSACLAGFTVLLFAPEDAVVDDLLIRLPGKPEEKILDWATRELGMSEEQARAIFLCTRASTGGIPNKTALARMKYLIDHPNASEQELKNITIYA